MFREFIEQMRSEGIIYTDNTARSKIYEVGRVLEEHDGKHIVELTNVLDSEFPLLANICTSREILAKSMGITTDKLHSHLHEALRAPLEPKVVEDAPFLHNVDEHPNINNHPVPKFFKEDAGHYYTSGLVITKGLDTGIHNSSIHRQLIISDTETTARIVPRHLFHNIRVAESQDQDLPIAIAFGMHPAVILAASTPTEIELDEMHVANTLVGGKLRRVRLPVSGILVPTHAEVVYEGVVIKHRKHKEGPFVDVTGTLDKVREEPVFRIDRIYYRNDAYMTTILPSRIEHFLLMGLGREARIKEFVSNVVPKVKDVYLPPSGGGWLHAIVSVKKQTEGDGKNVIMAAFAAHASLKWVTVVDTDIDILDAEHVNWAVTTRTGENDIIVIPKARGSSLDPSMDEESKTGIKVGIDATMSLYKSIDSYRRIEIPKE
ncbi:MAG: UbiD family decarboxylase [Candidatus Heimdallarchaeota archaeon]|nr:UbiD family decarboxylase [Candidatus Heimdallarchaeota archaeon]